MPARRAAQKPWTESSKTTQRPEPLQSARGLQKKVGVGACAHAVAIPHGGVEKVPEPHLPQQETRLASVEEVPPPCGCRRGAPAQEALHPGARPAAGDALAEERLLRADSAS
jgi:hypothetical protein